MNGSRTVPFSPVELVVALVLLGVLAAVSVPHLTRASEPSRAEQLRHHLRVLRIAIDMYHRDHGAYPAQRDAGGHYGRACTEQAFISQLTMYTDAGGHVAEQPSARFRFGPYLREVPRCPLREEPAACRVLVQQRGRRPDCVPGTPSDWVYDCRTGYIVANSDACDPDGVRYDTY